MAPVPSLTSVPTDFFTDDASTLTAVISASPIIRADAVAAVRRGLRRRVVARQHADGAEQPADRGAEPAHDRSGGERREHHDGDQHQHGADPDRLARPCEPVRDVPLNRIARPATRTPAR